jgi:hypothetical protein
MLRIRNKVLRKKKKSMSNSAIPEKRINISLSSWEKEYTLKDSELEFLVALESDTLPVKQKDV